MWLKCVRHPKHAIFMQNFAISVTPAHVCKKTTYICWHCWWQDNFWHSTSMGRNGESTNYSQRSNVKKQLTIIILSLVQITKKANCTLGFLHWNLRHCPTACKQNTYLALIHCWNTEPSSWTHTKAVTRWSKFSKAQHASKPGTIGSKHLSMSDMNNCASLSYICVQDSQGARASNASRYHNLDNSWLSRTKDVKWGNTFCV